MWPVEQLGNWFWHQGWLDSWFSQAAVHRVLDPRSLWHCGVCCRSGLPGEEEGAAAQGQRICSGPAAEPGARLGALGRRPKGFGPRPRAPAEAAGKPAAGEAEPRRTWGCACPFPPHGPSKCPG